MIITAFVSVKQVNELHIHNTVKLRAATVLSERIRNKTLKMLKNVKHKCERVVLYLCANAVVGTQVTCKAVISPDESHSDCDEWKMEDVYQFSCSCRSSS